MSKKKFLVLVLCAAPVFMTLMSGCGGASQSGVPTLVWWQIGPSVTGFNEDLKIISDYTQEKIGVRIDVKLAGWADANQRFSTMVNAGEYFDIMFVDKSTYNRFASLGALADITDIVSDDSPELKAVVPEVLWEGIKIKGRIYSVPTYKDSSKTGYYFWDDRYVQKYGIDLNKTGWAYLDGVFRKIKAGEGDHFYPMILGRPSNNFIFDSYDMLSLDLGPIGVRLDDENRRVVNTLEQTDIQEALRYHHSWYKSGIINPDANMVDEWPKNRPFFIAQAWPSVAISYALLGGIEKYDAVKFFGPSYSNESIQGSMNAVSVNSKYKKEAVKFLELVNTDKKLRDMIGYGIEGKYFQYVNDGAAVHQLRDDWPLTNYQEGNYFIETPLDAVPENYWNEVLELNEQAIQSTMLGFMPDITPIQNEMMNCRTIWDKYKYDLQTGAVDPDVILPKLTVELKANGFDKLMEEIQRQIDEYFKQ